MIKDDEIKLGVTVNELEIISYSNKPEDYKKYESYGGPWVRCRCSCGKEIVAPLYGIKNGFIKSCGHLKGQQGAQKLKEYYENHDAVNATYLTVEGETKNITEWSRITGIPRTTILYRLNKKLPLKEVFKKEIDEDDTESGNQSE